MPALAVVGADHQIIRSTETFRRKYEDAAALCTRSPELDLVLTGQTDTAVVDLGDFSLAIEAVTDGAGKRQAMLSLPAEDLAADPESPLGALREAADESPAIVWVKDLDGRYLYINPRYERELETSEERLRGQTDADLPPVETVDGPRLRYIEDGLKEPLQLEYSVPAFELRPPMAAFRFALRTGNGQPIGTCGVAAPSNEAQVARDEAVRLMQLERWNRLDPIDVRAEVLEQWHVQAKRGPAPHIEPDGQQSGALNGRVEEPPKRAPVEKPATPRASVAAERLTREELSTPAELPAEPREPIPLERQAEEAAYRREDEWVRQLRQAARIAATDDASETADALQSDLQLARKWAERADQLQGDLQEANARARAAEAEAQQAHGRVLAAEVEAQQAATAAQLVGEESSRYRTELEQVRVELEQVRQELEREKGEAQAARSEVEVARRELDGARARAEALRGPADASLRLSEELGLALSAEQERGDELARTLARIKSRLGDLEGALEHNQPASPHGE
jgi:PAS domain-containing protein